MTAYVIFIRDRVRDAAKLARYAEKARAAGAGHPLTPLAYEGPLETLEGESVDGVVLLSFPSMEAARDWYASSAYQQAIPYRQRGGDYRAILVEGLDARAAGGSAGAESERRAPC